MDPRLISCKMAETQLLENSRNIWGCRKTAKISAIFKQSEHVGTTPKEEGLKLLENSGNSGQIIRTETLLENGRNFGCLQTKRPNLTKLNLTPNLKPNLNLT